MPKSSPPDPFSCLDYHYFISGRLTLLKIPSGMAGEWLSVDEVWHRRLTACAFLWLRDRVNDAISSGTLSDGFTDALTTLELIRVTGINNGVFTEDESSESSRPDPGFQFNAGIPHWADDL